MHEDKNQSCLQIYTVIFVRCGQTCSKYPKLQVAVSFQYLKKEVRDGVHCLHADKDQSFLQVDANPEPPPPQKFILPPSPKKFCKTPSFRSLTKLQPWKKSCSEIHEIK